MDLFDIKVTSFITELSNFKGQIHNSLHLTKFPLAIDVYKISVSVWDSFELIKLMEVPFLQRSTALFSLQ